MSVQIKFCGAAGTVTGSCYWMRLKGCQFLVDCGLFQGTKTIKELNYSPFPFNPSEIEFVLLTHAHIDHSGLIPKLVKGGFKGPIYTTSATHDLLSYMLPDSGYIQEFEVEQLNRRKRQRGQKPVSPIYNLRDAEASIHQIRNVSYNEWLRPNNEVQVRFWNAGHILGSASIEVEIMDGESKLRLLFSGDIGPDHKLFHPDPHAPSNFDYVFCESTYGGRIRSDASIGSRREILMKEINDAMKAGGALIIPSFAVERTQELLLDIAYLIRHDLVPCSTVFLDSPLAIRITSVFAEHAPDLENIPKDGFPFTHPGFKFTETSQESKAIARFSGGVIILAASGMCDAGRIRHHLKNHLWRPKSTVLLVGYQAEGTLGSLLEKGVKSVRIQGDAIEVRARIRKIDIYSGHADGEGLIQWLNARQPIKNAVFLTHGSEKALEAMREELLEQGFEDKQVIIPSLDDEFELHGAGKYTRQQKAIRRLEPDVVEKLDWHNELAQLTLDIRSLLEQLPSDQQKTNLLKKLHNSLKS